MSTILQFAIRVNFFSLSADGLHMIYQYGGKNVNARFAPTDAADLMKCIGLIDDYFLAGDTPVITFDKDCEDGEGNWQSVTENYPWDVFIATRRFQPYEQAALAEINEGHKEVDTFQTSLKTA